jgi:phosphatidylglycerophosphate synthase
MVIDEVLLKTLLAHKNVLLAVQGADGPRPVAALLNRDKFDAMAAILRGEVLDEAEASRIGVVVVSAVELAGTHNLALRKKAAPFVIALSEATAREAERITFDASYKGVTDFVTKWIWPPVALPITRFMARHRVRPNMVTLASLVCVLAALALFAGGDYAAGLAVAWLMALLDTVDGKLARVTLTSSTWGNVFDHGIDLIAPPLWWLAWWYSFDDRYDPLFLGVMAVVIGGFVLGKLLEKAFSLGFGIKTHVWRPLDSAFRQITARRNTNLAILTLGTLAGLPVEAYFAVAVWTVISLGFHLVRLFQAAITSRNGTVIRSWLEA